MAVGERKRKLLLEFTGKWEGNDIDEVFDRVMKERAIRFSKDLLVGLILASAVAYWFLV